MRSKEAGQAIGQTVPPWRAVFSRSRLGPHLYVVGRPAAGAIHELCGFHDKNPDDAPPRVADRIGAPWRTWLVHRGDLHRSTCFLDGGVISNDKTYFFGLDGTWVLGSLALRYLCGRLGVRQPSSRLDGLDPIPHARLDGLLRKQLIDADPLRARLESFRAGQGSHLVTLAAQTAPQTSALLAAMAGN